MRSSTSLYAILFGALLLGVAGWLAGRSVWNTPSRALIVYCAHDAEYAEPILKEFERRTGIPVLIRFDTEATKTLGLINLLVREKSQPRCDVFWNNELLGMLDLQEQGVLAPYRGSGHARIPDQYKDPDGHWTGFAARLRVHIVNTNELPPPKRAGGVSPLIVPALSSPDAAAVDAIWQENNLDRVAIAKPLYGTTLVHYSVLSHLWGIEKLKAWHRESLARGLQVVNGNATVKNLVAQGACRTGWTDTDDFFVAKDAKQPVAMLPIRVGKNQTICIPNCVGLIKGGRHTGAAQQLIDYLLSAETELKLAQSTSRQIPLGKVDAQSLPPEVRELAVFARDGFDLRTLRSARQECVKWLSEEYVGRAAP